MRSRRRVLQVAAVALASATSCIAMIASPIAASADTKVVTTLYGASGGTCGGWWWVGTSPYGYPGTTIDTPAEGQNQCFATHVKIVSSAGTADSGLQGASAAAWGPQFATPIKAQLQGCPSVYNCSGWATLYP